MIAEIKSVGELFWDAFVVNHGWHYNTKNRPQFKKEMPETQAEAERAAGMFLDRCEERTGVLAALQACIEELEASDRYITPQYDTRLKAARAAIASAEAMKGGTAS